MITDKTLRMTSQALAGLSLLVGAAQVQATTWNTYTNTTCQASSLTLSCTSAAQADANGSSGGTATISGWANRNSGTSTNTTGYWRAANISRQGDSGVGINHGNTTTDPNEGTGSAPGYEHAVDNDGRTDALRFHFADGPVALSQLTLGWYGSDYDITVLRWTGAGTLPLNTTAGSMTHWGVNANTNVAIDSDTTVATANSWSGWELVGNYAGEYSGPSGTDRTVAINANGATSSYWLVMAYNSAFGGGTGLGMGNDAFKLLSFASTTPRQDVSEPGALALASLGLLALLRRQRRKN